MINDPYMTDMERLGLKVLAWAMRWVISTENLFTEKLISFQF